MSKKLQKAANERDQKSILKYAKVTEEECIKEGEGHHEETDTTALESAEIGTELKDATSTPKRKRSQVSPTHNSEYSKPSKLINMSKTPEENKQDVTQTASQHYYEKDKDDESTLSPELAKLERILSRKQTASLEGIKNDIKLLLENEELIKRQQDTIEELKRENYELNVKYNKLEKNQTRLKKRVSDIENELYSSNAIVHGLSENEYEDGPERYRLITEVIARTISASSYEEQIQIARKIPIKKTYRLGRYNTQRGRPIVINFVYHEDCENLLSNKKYLPRGIFADRQYSQDTENKRRILRPIYKTAVNHHQYKGRCKMEGEFLRIQGRRYRVNNIRDLPQDLSSYKCTTKEDPDTIGFYGELNPMSNFYNCEFTSNHIKFHSSEQLIQFNKAKHFGDHVTMSQILYADTPLECKQLSRDIANYDDENWKQVARNMCQDGIMEKFKQNPSIGETLLNTGNKRLVECSFDKFWGTGVSLSNRNCLDKKLWANNGGILGEMLMKTRELLRKNSNNVQTAELEPELMEATASNETT